MVASAAISLTLTPVLCSLFLKEQGLHPASRFNRIAEGGFDWMLATYNRGLEFVFRHQFLTLLSTLALIVVTGYLYVMIPKGFFPQQDTGFIFGEVDAREDISFKATAASGASDRRYRAPRARRRRRHLFRRRLRLQPDREHGADVHPAEAA